MSNTQWKRIGAAGGITYVVLQLLSQSLVQIGGSEPSFAASAGNLYSIQSEILNPQPVTKMVL